MHEYIYIYATSVRPSIRQAVVLIPVWVFKFNSSICRLMQWRRQRLLFRVFIALYRTILNVLLNNWFWFVVNCCRSFIRSSARSFSIVRLVYKILKSTFQRMFLLFVLFINYSLKYFSVGVFIVRTMFAGRLVLPRRVCRISRIYGN